MSHKYHFTSTWSIPSSPAEVYRALYDLAAYPRWWPQFRSVMRIDDRQHRMTVRSFLPYDIDYTLSEEIADEGTGILQGWADGDIVGRIRWELVAGGAGTRVIFDEDVVTRLALLELLAPVARPAFGLNHRLMMRDGRLGLIAFLAGRDEADPGAAPGGAWQVVPLGGPPPARRRAARRRT